MNTKTPRLAQHFGPHRFEILAPVSDDSYLQYLRRRPERLKPGELVLAIDFDWTITSPQSLDSFYGNPELNAYADSSIRELSEMGWFILIHSARFNHERFSEKQRMKNARHIEQVFTKNKMPFDRMWLAPGKPMATFYIDDRAFFPGWFRTTRFLRDYMSVAEEIFTRHQAEITYAEAMKTFRRNRGAAA